MTDSHTRRIGSRSPVRATGAHPAVAPSSRWRVQVGQDCPGRADPCRGRQQRRCRLRDHHGGPGRVGGGLGSSVLCREVRWLFRGRARPAGGAPQPLVARCSRWPDRPPQRHPGAELDPLQPYLIHQLAQQPKAPAAGARLAAVGVGGTPGWWRRAMIQDRRLNPVAGDGELDLDELPPCEPYSTALVAASLSATTTSSAISSEIPRRQARAARRTPPSRVGEGGMDSSNRAPPSGSSAGIPMGGVSSNVRERASDQGAVPAAGGGVLEHAARGGCSPDDWVEAMGARRGEEWAPPLRLRRWGSSWSPGQTPVRPPASRTRRRSEHTPQAVGIGWSGVQAWVGCPTTSR